MKNEDGIIYIKIGGIEYPTKVLYKDIENFYSRYDKICAVHSARLNLFHDLKKKNLIDEQTPEPKFLIPNEYFFHVLWVCLIKHGRLFWKKPFKSKRQMINNVLFDEMKDITLLVSEHVLKFEKDAADPEGKKKQDTTD